MIRTGRVWGPTTLIVSATNEIFTVPTNTTLIIKELRLTNYSGAGVTVDALVNGNAQGNRVLRSLPVPASSTVTPTTYMCLNGGDTLRLVASAASSCVAMLSGTLLTGDNPDLPL